MFSFASPQEKSLNPEIEISSEDELWVELLEGSDVVLAQPNKQNTDDISKMKTVTFVTFNIKFFFICSTSLV